MNAYNKKLFKLREYYIAKVEEKIPYIKINGHREKRLAGNSNISFKFIDGQQLLLKLDEEGICASSGSACNSSLANTSHVLLAIGVDNEYAKGALWITFSFRRNRIKNEVV